MKFYTCLIKSKKFETIQKMTGFNRRRLTNHRIEIINNINYMFLEINEDVVCVEEINDIVRKR